MFISAVKSNILIYGSVGMDLPLEQILKWLFEELQVFFGTFMLDSFLSPGVCHLVNAFVRNV